jgi:phosphotriesterase-related protein
MGKIVTVLGEIPAEELGFCQSHEHISIEAGQPCLVNPALRIDDEKLTAVELRAFYLAGGRALVDAQPVGCGRNAEALRSLSASSGVHVIASTGFHKMTFYPVGHWIFSGSAGSLADLFIRELEEGMYADGDDEAPSRRLAVRASQIKTALDGEIDGEVSRLFHAAADANKETGAPLMVHVEKNSDPIALANLLERWGVDAETMIFCHMDRMIPDLKIHRELCARGVHLEYDTIARPRYHSDDHEADITMEMIESGCEGRLLMGLDVTRERMRSYGGVPGLDHILRGFIPLLLSKGVSEDTVRAIFVDNPASVFSRRGDERGLLL